MGNRLALLVLVLAGSVASLAVKSSETAAAPKKLIYYGWGMPDTQYLRDHCREMEEIPFDGVGITVAVDRSRWRAGDHDTRNRLGYAFMTGRKYSVGEFAAAIADLETAPCEHLRDQFLEVVLSSGLSRDVSWFDDTRWRTVVGNVRVLAEIAKKGHASGLILDPEHYDNRLFDYSFQSKLRAGSFSEYTREAHARGRQIGAALSEVFPETRLLSLFGYTLPLSELRREKSLELCEYSLLPAFFDGLLEGLPNEAELIDGYEFSYAYKRSSQFREGYRAIHTDAAKLSARPEIYRRKIRAGFGVWIDYQKNPSYFRAEELESTVRAALETSDRYVWIYSELVGFFPRQGIAPDYIEAIRRARAATN